MPLSVAHDRRASGPAATGSLAERQSSMVRPEYRYAIEIYSEAGGRLGQVAVVPDWEPALESVRFEGMRRGRLPAVHATPMGSIEPIWHAKLKPPYVSGFRAAVRDTGGAEICCEIATAYLRTAAHEASAGFVQKGDLKSGELFTYLVCAFPAGTPPSVACDVPAFTVEEVVEPLPLVNTPLQHLLANAEICGEPHSDDVPVFIPQRVLDEAVALARGAGDSETGGILVGTLHSDREVPELFVEVTALIAAPHTLANATQVTFTAETWAAVDAVLALRRRNAALRQRNEMKLGWFHSHPDWCRKCPAEKRENCQLSRPFLSAEDVHLHRVCFGRAYHLALLISDNIHTGPTWSLFGWRRGMVMPRAFHILREPQR
jgi:proteasome lid subunit RPN8/RPN11